ncbi:hypothetical protein M422DRAFT_28041 [Sphaerobolus stellatus SS14]|nr:hypothetical protein M422DRAFT_28041 [Sphaerobolus stellatus SS14]
MSRTRWGKNWGSFQRVEWVNDANLIDQFFNEKQSASVSEYLSNYRRQFGVLLLVFEWGTTQPFYIPPSTDPITAQIAPVVKKAILPGIITTYQSTHPAQAQAHQHK